MSTAASPRFAPFTANPSDCSMLTHSTTTSPASSTIRTLPRPDIDSPSAGLSDKRCVSDTSHDSDCSVSHNKFGYFWLPRPFFGARGLGLNSYQDGPPSVNGPWVDANCQFYHLRVVPWG